MLLGFILVGCSLLPPATNQPSDPANQNVTKPTEGSNVNTNQGQSICVDQCGDGTCQEIVCLATGCPCAETAERCPADCS